MLRKAGFAIRIGIAFVAMALADHGALAAQGGPDGYGYTWLDSDEVGFSYDYEFAPTSTTLGDDDYIELPIGFSFEFYGQNYIGITVTSNGLAHFEGATALTFSNQQLPYLSYATVCPFWDDLNPENGGSIWYGTTGSSPNRVFIAEWWGVPHYPDVDSAYFELKLFEIDDSIEFHYDDVDFGSVTYDNGASATVGIGDGAQGYGLQRSYNQAVLSDSYAVRFEPPPPCWDADGDGYMAQACGGDDCDDGDPAVHPNAAEVCDGVPDNDCNGVDDPDEIDNDGDGYDECDNDCNDAAYTINPGAQEQCGDGQDNDCDGLVDEDVDADGDGWWECDGDCDDDVAADHP